MQKSFFRITLKPEALFVSCAMFLHAGLVAAEESDIVESRQQELRHLLIQDCGSCHGLTLEGGLGPPLLPENVAGKPRQWLRKVILDGIPGTAMPPWRPFINDAEADWLAGVLQQGALNE